MSEMSSSSLGAPAEVAPVDNGAPAAPSPVGASPELTCRSKVLILRASSVTLRVGKRWEDVNSKNIHARESTHHLLEMRHDSQIIPARRGAAVSDFAGTRDARRPHGAATSLRLRPEP